MTASRCPAGMKPVQPFRMFLVGLPLLFRVRKREFHSRLRKGPCSFSVLIVGRRKVLDAVADPMDATHPKKRVVRQPPTTRVFKFETCEETTAAAHWRVSPTEVRGETVHRGVSSLTSRVSSYPRIRGFTRHVGESRGITTRIDRQKTLRSHSHMGHAF